MMYKKCTDLTASVASGSNQIQVADASWIDPNDTLLLFDADTPDGENVTVSAKNGNTLTLSANISNSYTAGYNPGRGAAVADPSGGHRNPNTDGRLTNAYGAACNGSDGGTFVEFKLPSDGAGDVPHQNTLSPTSNPTVYEYSDVWFKNDGKSNYIHVIGAKCYGSTSDGQLGGGDYTANVACVYVGTIWHDYAASHNTVKADVSVHEVGHQFNLASTDGSHPNVWCHEGNGTDYCVMDYDRDREDAYSEFCYDNPNHIDEVRDTADGI
jgi:hypothetical protein